MSYQPGNIILGKYRIETLVGQGAFAEVYCATHLGLNTLRALKVLRRDAPGLGSTEYGEYQSRFNLEAQLGAKLNHPNIVQVHDFERDGENLILVMEYAAGGSLGKMIEQMRQDNKPVALKRVLDIILQVSQGLGALHELDVVHRDLKPTNILFNNEQQIKVADLGLAQVAGGPSMRSQLSNPQPHPGTPAYMSPEQHVSTQYLTPSSDIFAVGLILFEILTGRVYANQRPGTRASSLQPGIPAWLDDLLIQMLDEDPKKRPWNGKELAELLTKKQQGETAKQTVVTPPVTVGIKQRPSAKINRPGSPTTVKQVTKEKKNSSWTTVLPITALIVALGFCATVITLWLISSYFTQTPAAESPTQTAPFSSDTPNVSNEPTFNNSPTSEPLITNAPTDTSLSVPTESFPTETNACTLYLCQDSTAENVCAYGLSQTATQFIATFKFQRINPTLPLLLSYAGKSLDCELVPSYPDRIYCAGDSISSSKETLSLYSGGNLICSGDLVIPKYVTPIPTPKKEKPKNTYP